VHKHINKLEMVSVYRDTKENRVGCAPISTTYYYCSLCPKKDKTIRSGYSKTLEYEYKVKTAALGTLKRYSIISLTLYLEWYSAYSIAGSGGPH
jgi:hypothetical protein